MHHMVYMHHMKRMFTSRKTISVHVEESEYKWIELQASGNMSEWCREIILGVMPERSGTDIPAVHGGVASKMKARQVSTSEEPKGTGRKPPKDRDMADHVESESHTIICKCGHSKYKHRDCIGVCQESVCACGRFE